MKINSKRVAAKCIFGCTLFATVLTTVGCETLTIDAAGNKRKKKEASWFSFKKKEYQSPQSVTATWSHDILTLPGKPATRGFGGRFYFYNEKTQAIPVDGELVVYGFDDTNKQQSTEDLSQATKRFRFTPEQFTTHFSEGELGASYSVWIPWDEAFGAPKKIMLIPTFLTKEGRTIRGAAASLNLPGSTKESQVQQAAAFTLNGGQTNAIAPPNSNAPSENSGLRTTTIQVPSNSFIRQSHTADMSSNITEFQSQQLAAASHLVANSFGPNGPNYATNATQTGVEPFAPPAPANVSFGQPTSLPSPQNTSTKDTNGWVSPVFAPMSWPAPSPRSAPSQFPAPTSKGVQPSSYPPR